MPKPLLLQIWWTPSLYSPDLAEEVATTLQNPDILAIVNRRQAATTSFGTYQTVCYNGNESYRTTPKGVQLITNTPLIKSGSKHHHYKDAVWECDEPGTSFISLLINNAVLVLPGKTPDRKRKKTLEAYGILVLKEPKSGHDRMQVNALVEQIKTDLDPILKSLWGGNTYFADTTGTLPAPLL